jgi:hypothetical protein
MEEGEEMNQITQMFQESNTRMKQIMKGEFKLEQVSSAQREFEGQIKLINAVVSAFGIASKNKRAMTGLERMNLMDETTAIDLMLGDPEVDKVKCPEHDDLITRSECLDYSGSHSDECSGCEIGIATKDKLIPVK